MKIQSLSIVLTIVNLVILSIVFAQMRPTYSQQQKVTMMLRARGLEIVDSLGRIRASISLQPAVVVEGKFYPQTVLLRLIDSHGKPLVKLGAAENGGGLSLIDKSDEGVLIHARDSGSFMKITHKGKERIIQP